MSSRYTADGKRKSSMTHARHTFTCTCGKTVAGNGGKSGHRRACDGSWLSFSAAYDARWKAISGQPATWSRDPLCNCGAMNNDFHLSGCPAHSGRPS